MSESNANNLATNTDGKELVVTRTFTAPRELVFKVWTESEHLAHWWGPKGSTINVSKLDLRPGGLFLYSMQHPDGIELWGKFVYHEVVAPEKLVYISSFSDPVGNTVPAPFFEEGKWPLEILNELTLDEQDGKTTVTLRGGPINATEEQIQAFAEMHGSMQQGFAGSFDQLEEYMAKL
jgi:uncharacterized protein YndB with AHSA1/START domain